MTSLENLQSLAVDDVTFHQIGSRPGTVAAADMAGCDLVIQDLDQCSDATPAWTYCG